MITQTDLLEANADLMMADLDGEAVLLNLQTGRYFGLNQVGTSIWAMITAPCTVADVIAGIQKDYDVPAEQLEKDVLAFLEAMEKRSLIHIVTPVNA